ncbi:MAG: type II toxin-antitoxin system VapC family toxin [Armatimonadota bacterium]|nr:type II toxin-antitoxin system VapC family toxin [Armatimonadota bacterium]
MSGRFLLDTNIVIARFSGEVAIQERILQADEIFLCSIVLGELYFGARKSGRVVENTERIDLMAAGNTILPCDAETALQYGIIKHQLREKGRPIPENDIWIAAIARQHDLILATRDDHFTTVEDLQWEMW